MNTKKLALHVAVFAVCMLLLFFVAMINGVIYDAQAAIDLLGSFVYFALLNVIIFAVASIGYLFLLLPKRLRKIIWIFTGFEIIASVVLIVWGTISAINAPATFFGPEVEILLLFIVFVPFILHVIVVSLNVSTRGVGKVIDVTSMGKVNLHTHTTFCDGKNTAAEMAEAAFNAGYDTLGFSGHTPCAPANLISDSWGTKADDMPAYIAEVKRLKEEYSGRMEVLCGVEWDTFSDIPSSDFDYVIGSVHGLEKDGKIYWIDISREHFEEMLTAFGSAEQLVKKYYAEYKKLSKKQFVDITGHFDLITLWNRGNKYFDEEAAWYIATAVEAADAVIASGKIIEINSNAVFKGLRDEPYPAPLLLEHIRSKGGKTIESLDAHGIERFG